jgi:hypothetical protein
MRNVWETHPRTYCFVTVQSPIDSTANRAHCKEAGDQKHERQRSYYKPLFSSQVFHALFLFVQSNSSNPVVGISAAS